MLSSFFRTQASRALAPALLSTLVTLGHATDGRALDRPPTVVALATRSELSKDVRVASAERASGTTTRAPAGTVARAIAQRVRGFPSFRGQIPLASWREEPAARWSVRSSAACLRTLAKLRVPVRALERELTTPVPTPLVLTGKVGGVAFRPLQRGREVELSCELASRLPALAAILRKHGVRVARVNSSYRDQPYVSFHTFGLALDLAAFETSDGPLVVASDFELTPEVPTCDARPRSERGRKLLALACDLWASALFSSVLTPNYNEGHRDHFHLDVRPDDARLFVR